MAPRPRTSLLCLILLLAMLRHYGRELAPVGMRGIAMHGMAAVLIVVLAWAWWCSSGHGKAAALVLGWLTFEEAQVALCSALYIREPWAVAPGQPLCSALVGLDLGAFGICAIALIVAFMLSELTGSFPNHRGQDD